ncbi:MAG: metal ABC transporter substrate-binding protein [Kiritimatiellae bacterium]|jgi:zinc/manganese transport system substrate-binding protein|nr:metal ABC transporter substrate-binding protein [Kiritimatiellia bacterium]
MKISNPSISSITLPLLSGIAITWFSPLLCLAGLTAASLNPIVTDLARQVGGDRVEIIELMKAGDNPHVYEPNPEQLRAANQTDIILAAGKKLESYLPDLRDSLGRDKTILEVGNEIPSLKLSKSQIFICCPDHASSQIDPHWWHSIKNLQRGAVIIADAFSKISPENADFFTKQSRDYCKQLDKLNRWVKKEIYKIPRKRRILTTAHTSFGYFCRDFGFKSIPIQGLSSEVNTDPKHMTDVIKVIKKEGVTAIFPEKNVNPKLLEMVMREAGVKNGGYLLAGSPEPESPTCIAMIRYNVTTIVNALAPVATQ